jgi:hypothetical protein
VLEDRPEDADLSTSNEALILDMCSPEEEEGQVTPGFLQLPPQVTKNDAE